MFLKSNIFNKLTTCTPCDPTTHYSASVCLTVAAGPPLLDLRYITAAADARARAGASGESGRFEAVGRLGWFKLG